MKIAAYCALRYGKPYLADAIRSVIDAVDDFIVLYARVPSHGTDSMALCPDTEDELLSIAERAAGNKLTWVSGYWRQENEQRNSATQYTDADILLVLDSDEIWRPDQLETLIRATADGQVRYSLARGIHYWRSFYRAVIHDPASPVRSANLRNPHGSQTLDVWFSHMGYSQPKAYIWYKMQIHGHRSDWRPEWYQERFLANAQVDCHPCGSEWWNPEPVNPWDYLPEFMRQHPFANMEVIE